MSESYRCGKCGQRIYELSIMCRNCESNFSLRPEPAVAASADAQDAARYRWLRDHFKADYHRATSDYWVIKGEYETPAECFRGDVDLNLDSAIDLAMSRYTLTESGYRAVMQQGAKLNGEVKAGEGTNGDE